MEDKKMFEILHNNCKQEQERKIKKEEEQKKEQQNIKKRCRRIMILGIACVIFEIAVLIIERVI